MKPPVCLWILVARTDVPYMLETIPHLVRACNYPFVEKVLAVDTSPLRGDMRYRYSTGSQADLEAACQKLINDGVIDRVAKIDYDPKLIARIYQKYFGVEQAAKMANHTHNWKGSTIYASLYCIEVAASNYYLHFDADMMLYQNPNYDWISEAIKLMDSVPEIAVSRPMTGPPHPEDRPFHPNPYTKDERGFYAHKFFSMRAYLVNRDRFAQLSPIPLLWKHQPLMSRKIPKPILNLLMIDKIERKLRGIKSPVDGALDSFEIMTSKRLRDTEFIRADLSSSQAWTIHPPKHSEKYVRSLPNLIRLIEQGKYPASQAGHYDLKLEAYLELLDIKDSQ